VHGQSQYWAVPVVYSSNPPAGILRPAATFLNYVCTINIIQYFPYFSCGCVDWIGLAQDRDRWRALVSAVMNRRVP
jgi:hypothetical protein